MQVALYSLGFAVVIIGLWKDDNCLASRILSVWPLVYLGRLSCGFYLIHLFTFRPVFDAAKHSSALAMVPLPISTLLVTLALSALSWHFLETPINNWKKRFPLDRT